jgi:hypothetical protein
VRLGDTESVSRSTGGTMVLTGFVPASSLVTQAGATNVAVRLDCRLFWTCAEQSIAAPMVFLRATTRGPGRIGTTLAASSGSCRPDSAPRLRCEPVGSSPTKNRQLPDVVWKHDSRPMIHSVGGVIRTGRARRLAIRGVVDIGGGKSVPS